MMSLATMLAAVMSVGATFFLPPSSQGLLLARAATGGEQASGGDRARFTGTYELVTIEEKDQAGKWSQVPDFNSSGFIIYANTGHMGVQFQNRVRVRFAGNVPTGEEAQAALRSYTAYFGTFDVDDRSAEKRVIHHRMGNINPGGATEVFRYYDFVTMPNGSERLILTPPPADGGGKGKATRRLVWQRILDAPLSPEEKKFVGFHRLLYTDTVRLKDGKEVFHGNKVENRSGTSYIIYTSSGHMMVHLMDNKGRVKYAGAQPTPDEALKAYQSYTAYFGRFRTYENQNPKFVYHSLQGSTGLRLYGEQQRFYEFNGNVLRLGAPMSRNEAGEMTGGHLYWERQGPAK